MFGAILQSNGKYTIVEVYPFHSKTFYIKNKLKELGGYWNSQTRRWEDIDVQFLKDIPGGVTKRMKIRIAPYSACNESVDRYAYCHEIQNNQVKQLNMADDYEWVNVEEIYGEG